MIKEEKVLNHDLPQEVSDAPIFVCTKTEKVGKEEVTKAWDPATNESVDINDQSNLMTFEVALEMKENAPIYTNAGVGLVLRREDPYMSIEISEAKNSDGELNEVARETIDTLEGECYAEIVGTTLIMIIKGSSTENKRFKNINVSYSNSNHLVPIRGHAVRKPNIPWANSTRLEEVRDYHFKRNCQIDETAEQLPDHYVKTNNGGFRLLSNVLASTLLKQKDLLMCNSMIYVREKGNGVFHKVEIDEIECEIMDYLSPKYLTNKEIEDTKKLLIKRIRKDNDLTDPKRMDGKVNFKNGVYDIKTGTFGPYVQSYRTAFQLNVKYNPDAKCTRFNEYIKKSLTKDDAKTVQEMIGYLITTKMEAQKAFLLYGPGNTGKSILIKIIEKIIGEDYVSNIPFQDLGTKFRTIQLYGKLLNSYGDLPQGNIKDTATFKALVSGDRMFGDDKFEKGFNFANTARLLFAANKLPSNLVDQSSGFYRRLVLIPFENIITNEDIDRELEDTLYEEREGIVQWSLIGLKRLIKNNYVFTESKAAKSLLKEYKRDNNSTLWFVDEHCKLDLSSKVSGKELYNAYKKACLDARMTAVTQREFNGQIESQFGCQGVAKYLGAQTRAVEFRGIKLINEN